MKTENSSNLLHTIHDPIESPSPIKDPPLKIQIEDPHKSKIANYYKTLSNKRPSHDNLNKIPSSSSVH